MRAALALARRLVMAELALYRSLLRWVARRPDVPAGAAAFAYVGAVAAVMWAFIAVSAIELVGVHLLLPWETVRLVADLLSLWGLLWMLGLLASFVVHPHLVQEAGLRVRHSAGVDILVPWDALAAVAVRRRSLERSRRLQLQEGDGGTVLHVVVGSQTNVDLELRRPLTVQGPKGPVTVTALRLYADDERALVTEVRAHLAAKEV